MQCQTIAPHTIPLDTPLAYFDPLGAIRESPRSQNGCRIRASIAILCFQLLQPFLFEQTTTKNNVALYTSPNPKRRKKQESNEISSRLNFRQVDVTEYRPKFEKEEGESLSSFVLNWIGTAIEKCQGAGRRTNT